uniref:amino acid ABC transporter ATP-binding protein n=1 Tax=Aminobacter niigataensis TaxID=83265 RepID=UPI002852A6CB|nr:amino acid ABC transporter ATP-binding protein [Aminobacter niigataensis]WMD00136.1 amino acid ABC transporter ATP-binding protein [Aminobacter niigataensis]
MKMERLGMGSSAIETHPALHDLQSEPNPIASAVAPLLSIRGLQKRFGSHEVIKHIDLDVSPGSVTFLIGPSGGGKSTVLRCVNFLETPSAGEILFAGERLCHMQNEKFHPSSDVVLRKARAQMPMVFQHFNLFAHRTALENVIEGPILVLGKSREQAVEQGRELLRRVGLLDRAGAYPAQLSGGQKQRVAIARAVAMEPRLILFDEPTSALDPELVSGVLDTIRALAEEGRTMIVVSHEMTFARKLADRVHFITGGVIAESGSPDEIFDDPKNERLKQFIRSILPH